MPGRHCQWAIIFSPARGSNKISRHIASSGDVETVPHGSQPTSKQTFAIQHPHDLLLPFGKRCAARSGQGLRSKQSPIQSTHNITHKLSPTQSTKAPSISTYMQENDKAVSDAVHPEQQRQLDEGVAECEAPRAEQAAVDEQAG